MLIHSTKYQTAVYASLSYQPRDVFAHGMSRRFDSRSTSGSERSFVLGLEAAYDPVSNFAFQY